LEHHYFWGLARHIILAGYGSNSWGRTLRSLQRICSRQKKCSLWSYAQKPL